MKLAAAAKKNRGFDPNIFLATIGDGRKILAVPKKQLIFAQGDSADAVFYIQKGKVRLTVVSKIGKEATIAIVNERNFFGQGALAGQVLRMGSAAAMTDCELLRVDKKAMMNAVHGEHAFSDMFVAYLLARNTRYEEDLVDQLFNSSEKRLARVLLLLAHFGKEGIPQTVVPEMSQETLADFRTKRNADSSRSQMGLRDSHFGELESVHKCSVRDLRVQALPLNGVLHD
jgi:CRP-like cAMP-binding protein